MHGPPIISGRLPAKLHGSWKKALPTNWKMVFILRFQNSRGMGNYRAALPCKQKIRFRALIMQKINATAGTFVYGNMKCPANQAGLLPLDADAQAGTLKIPPLLKSFLAPNTTFM